MIYTARCGCKKQRNLIRQMAGELGLRWYDVVEDCDPGESPETATCEEVNKGADGISTVRADVDANWKKPVLRALDEMRMWNNSRGGLWSHDHDPDDDPSS